MNKKIILGRLEMLIKLCNETDPDIPSDKYLFNQHSITVQEMMKQVRELYTQVIDIDSERELLINIMKESNKIWRIRNKIKKNKDNWPMHDPDGALNIELNEDIEDYIADGKIILAIKHYRQVLKNKFNYQAGLRECKDYIDEVRKDMKRKGVCI